MPKKKAAVSGFTILMKEMQQELAQKGQKYSMNEMKDIADPRWKQMPAEEKARYNQRAKAYKKEVRGTVAKLASDGTSIKENFEQIEEEERRDQQMLEDIRNFIGCYQPLEYFKGFAPRQVIYVMSFNILCCIENDEYVPLEVGITEYTVRKGIVRTYHKFIDPGRAAVGYVGEAKAHSEETHHIPFTGHKDSVKNYKLLWQEIDQFLCKGAVDDLPPVFCLRDDIEQTYSCLQWILAKAGVPESVASGVRVWDLGRLLHEMRSAAGASLVSEYIATEMLKKNTFDYEPDSRCDFHEDLDSPFCALGCAKRLCYLLSDCVCNVFDVEPTEQHLPLRSAEEKGYEIHYPNVEKSREFLESEIPRQISSRASERSWASSRAPSRNTQQSLGYGLDTFSDEEENDSVLSGYVSTSSVLTSRLPTTQMAGLSLDSSVGLDSFSDDEESSIKSGNTVSAVVNDLRRTQPPVSHTSLSNQNSSVGLETFEDINKINANTSVPLRQPRIPASQAQFRFRMPAVAPGHGIGRGRARN